MTIAVDFDGTIVEDAYPKIGKERPFAIATLKQLISDGHNLILWTVRKDERLQEAIEWCESRGVRFFAANKDFEDDELDQMHHSRKIKADLFIDDRMVGGLPDWGVIYQLISKKISYETYLYQQITGETPKKKRRWFF